MDRNEQIKIEQLKLAMRQHDYEKAVELADSLELKRVKDNNFLSLVADAYEVTHHYEDAKRTLLLAYENTSTGRQLAYRLCLISIKLKEYDEAEEFYRDFVDIAPRDTARYTLKYRIAKAKGEPIEDLIDILEEYINIDMEEKWAYELAKLYHMAGDKESCIDMCDEISLWFSEGKYVVKALELKKQYRPLTTAQNEKYEEAKAALINANLQKQKEEKKVKMSYFSEIDISMEDQSPKSFPEIEINPVEETVKTEEMQKVIADGVQDVMNEGEEEANIHEGVGSTKVAGAIGSGEFSEFKEDKDPNDDVFKVKAEDESEETAEEAPLEENAEEAPQEETSEEEPKEEPVEEMPQEENGKDTPVEEIQGEETSEEPKEDEAVEETPAEETPVVDLSDESALQKQENPTTVVEIISGAQLDEQADEDNDDAKQDKADDLLSSEDLKKFKEYMSAEGLEANVKEVLESLISEYKYDGTSADNNVVILGNKKTGKTTLAIDIIKLVNNKRGRNDRKVAKISSAALNKRGLKNSMNKLLGSDLIIENANKLDDSIFAEILEISGQYTDDMLIILEGEADAMRPVMDNHKELSGVFNYVIEIKEFNLKQWGEYACEYAKSQGYEMEDMAKLACHKAIDDAFGSKLRISQSDVDELVDKAIKRSGKVSRKLGRAFKKKKTKEGLFILVESDFKL
jgi:DNA replication protein DnaC